MSLLRYAVREEAIAAMICFVHGSGGNARVWDQQVAGLPGHPTLAVDLPGHGPAGGEGCVRIADYVAAVRARLDAVGAERTVLVGHSMGGAIAQAFALEHPDRLDALVLVGTGARLRVLPRIFETLERDHGEGVRFLMTLAVAPTAAPELVDLLARETMRTPPRVIIGDFRACDAFDVMSRVSSIALPTLIICGEEDRLTPPRYARYLRDHIPGARLVMVNGAGHYVQVERPAETTRAIAEFLAPFRAVRR
jgi:pimeloyl-ACP methyl ester carboxylesterase